MLKVARLTDIQDVTVSIGKQVHASGFLSDNREATESSIAVLVELSVSSVLLLRVELYRAALFVSLRNEQLNETESVSEKYNILMRFWANRCVLDYAES